MQRWMRRIRGAIGMGVIWAAVWASVGFIPRWVLGMQGDLPFPILFAGLGFFSGFTFSVMLMLSQLRSRSDSLSIPRVMAWGAAGGLLLGGLFVRGVSLTMPEIAGIVGTFVVASTASAAGSLALARRADRIGGPSPRGELRDGP